MGEKVDGTSEARQYQTLQHERRRSGRVEASGTAIVHGPSALHGRIVDLSIGGISVLVEGDVSPLEVGDPVHLSVRLDGVGLWFHLDGSVARLDTCGLTTLLAIELYLVPQDFEDLVQNELLSALECTCEPQILLVDSAPARRDLVAAAFRATGCRVIEVCSTLEAIAEIDQSRLHLWAIVIADTVIASRADDLRRFLRETYPRVPLIVVGSGRRTRAHLTLDQRPDLALQIHRLVVTSEPIGARA